jgi:hypothetical protein
MESGADRYPQAFERMETPFGTLYRPKSFGVQVPFLVGAFAGGPAVAWLIGQLLGGVSQGGQIFLYVTHASIFFLGYALWASRLAALAFNALGKQILRALFHWLIKKKNPPGIGIEELLPTRDKLEELVVRAQRAASSFLWVSILVGSIAGTAATLLQSQSPKWIQTVLVATGCILWGWLLTSLGRRGYLPMPEANE